ncbi:hypothetical protein SLEP1_g33633 [Rubroshorea leprosula]|uniref:Uncharacterized protein n=1 Tax=Rubroshorea leprosula TaxID=152421 RepID=A0AAV5KHI3_9ROSI|nr:hypothetical protein SLEP1_g33633 [Rubroshorea leprosula]
MAREHSSFPGQTAAMVTSVMAGTTMKLANPDRNTVTNRWLSPDNFFAVSIIPTTSKTLLTTLW